MSACGPFDDYPGGSLRVMLANDYAYVTRGREVAHWHVDTRVAEVGM